MKKLKSLSKIFLVSLMIFFVAFPAYATSLSDSPKQIWDDMLKDLGINTGEGSSLEKSIKLFNTSSYKKSSPQVSLTFSPENPEPGEEVTATAIPLYFMNDPSNLYYTWALKRKACFKKPECDYNANGDYDIEDYKIEAARIIASNGFDWREAAENGEYDQIPSYTPDQDGYKAYHGGNDQRKKQNIAQCFVHNPETGKEFKLRKCAHLFPNAPNLSLAETNVDFGLDKEKFWHTDPNNPDTAGTGNSDEANVIGLGVISFTWIYQSDDKIGLAVEGISIEPTEAYDSTYQTMWGFLEQPCYKEKYYELDTKVLLNQCLQEQMITPFEGGKAKILDVALSFSPETPTNDPEGKNGAYLMVNSYVQNSKNKNYLKYNWSVYTSTEANAIALDNIESTWIGPKMRLLGNPKTTGVGLNSFKLNLNFPDTNIKFLKIKVTVTENLIGGKKKKGTGYAIIPITNTSKKIDAYLAKVSANTTTDDIAKTKTTNYTITNEETAICKVSVICPVAKNEILALQISNEDDALSNFSWMINDKPLSCLIDECKSNGEATNKAYFPILGEIGTQYSVNLTAEKEITSKNNSDKSQEKVNLTKVFEVVEPEINIISADKSTCQAKIWGHYVDNDGDLFPDKSEDEFQAISGSEVQLSSASSIISNDITWYIDGIAINDETAPFFGASLDSETGNLTFKANKPVGESYSISAESLYMQNNSVRKLLSENFGIASSDFYEKMISKTITIDMVESLSGSTTAKAIGNKKILASLFSGMPIYLNFLFRIVLTSFLFFFVIKIIFNLLPKTNEN
ncbi:MAG: hypothetical protein COU40_03450 [Candidatus Moranbacteria bacterium CG10_big_fil_rev_8_21_14_0_10_35_21]|nr:MAG: hypothetical protein COU40_03450 [Candidatus Moranbacteria bacterium CG10_big_fil_rev_8_21_14_0_10_35_21]PJA88368.1 MAG: hypothetical protein CO139_03575 [Candidatus Moranbacteria bacterium CG_4_9_14_3_um_filter_36_9]